MGRQKTGRTKTWLDNTFSDLKTLTEYKEKFFPNDSDFEILSISFPETEFEEALDLTKPPEPNNGKILNLQQAEKQGN